jgi:hypothetical protein
MVNFMPGSVEGLLLKEVLDIKTVVAAGRVGLLRNAANYGF